MNALTQRPGVGKAVASGAPKQTARRPAVRVSAKPQEARINAKGFVNADNSGKGNIFPTKTKAFYSSPTADAAASEGLGGAQGGAVLAAAIALVGVATVAVLQTGSGETLTQVQGTDVESLSTIAGRIAASL